MIIIKTPLRVSFFGGGTDIKKIYEKIGKGHVINYTIDKYIYTFIKIHDGFNEKYRLNYSENENTNNLNDIKNNIIRETLKFYKIKEPLYVGTISDLPSNTGLGSSSSFCVSLILGVQSLLKKKISKRELAETAYHIEHNLVKSYCGKQDHYSASFGGINSFKFYKKDKVIISKFDSNNLSLNEIIGNQLSFFNKKQRNAKEILKIQQINFNKKKYEFYEHMNSLTDQAKVLILKNQSNFNSLASLIDKSWNIKQNFSKEISNDNINQIIMKSKKLGAYACKLSGAGGSGFIQVYSKPKYHDSIKKLFNKNNYDFYKLKLSLEGSKVLYNYS